MEAALDTDIVLCQRGWIKIRAVFSRRFWFITILLQNIAPRLDDAWGPGGPESADDRDDVSGYFLDRERQPHTHIHTQTSISRIQVS